MPVQAAVMKWPSAHPIWELLFVPCPNSYPMFNLCSYKRKMCGDEGGQESWFNRNGENSDDEWLTAG
jgi:hypothetical protein